MQAGYWQLDPQTHQAIAVVNQGVTMIIEGLTARKGNIPGVGGGPLTHRPVDRPARGVDRGLAAARHQRAGGRRTRTSRWKSTWKATSSSARATASIYADRMYYDVQNHVGTVLEADMLTPAPGYEGKVRLHADILQQIDEDRFRAQDALVTSSRLGIPRYRLQMGQASFEDLQTPRFDPVSGDAAAGPQAARPAADRSPGTGRGAEQRAVHRGRAGLLLADVRHGPERSVVLHPPRAIQRRTAFSARSS